MFRRGTKERKDFFIGHGAEVLEQTIQSFNGDCNPIRSFSAEELENATNHFHSEIHSDWNYILYRGIHQNREIAVKKLMEPNNKTNTYLLKFAANEIAIASRMSHHDNVLKLLGCCLETERPMLVYEYPENGNLVNRLFDRQAQDRLSWDQKLKIVTKIANSIAYLHHGLPNTFVHRDIKPKNIFLDRNLSPKLFDFKLALRIPKGETHIVAECISGTNGYIDPRARLNGRYTEKSDVYSFGVMLCEVLTEKSISDLFGMYYDTDYSESGSNGRIEFVWFLRDKVEELCKDYWEDEKIRVQVLEYVKIIRRCLKSNPEDRPNMIEAEKQLRRIKTL